MDPVTSAGPSTMYEQLHQAFKVAGNLGSWWRAPNGILHGCPLSVIEVNALPTIWKREMDCLCL